ncbi:MAG: hypothetical protein UW68_C0005G0023 [Candidatus Collierbacteria bacterium GW2011_GWB1_44_6]|uniref:Transcription elongation factor GreA/GreB C-terminal domain-containing protein n=2 Tax=Candidatus Collieribacteriota TaxID=1752725 RepID=A0A0G1JQH4_9BACT|nr:MAG: hypothetical protein UV68_C0001G0028 [Candidatus Collierbacteria bacterium GW2011_GWC2_43_12]KKT73630.1 MAG: hypothetical protein UW68_C0005G0023 [Candidatus Collierbacteria bacterium GW2011_GWB1_44_6]KKT84148.1 MAG: hypothetical protein UW80_C0001G0028 [Microgenomates group bacterium GW2011_GWC1_44_9]
MIDLKQKINTDLKAIEKRIRETATERDESATPMESAHDQTRQIANQLYNSLLDERKKLRDLNAGLEKYNQIFSVQNLSEETVKKYFIVPNGLGGAMVDDVILLSEKTPLAKMLGGAPRGKVFELNGQKFRIEKIEENV